MTFQVSDRREMLYTEQSENASPELLLLIGFCLFVCLFDSLRLKLTEIWPISDCF